MSIVNRLDHSTLQAQPTAPNATQPSLPHPRKSNLQSNSQRPKSTASLTTLRQLQLDRLSTRHASTQQETRPDQEVKQDLATNQSLALALRTAHGTLSSKHVRTSVLVKAILQSCLSSWQRRYTDWDLRCRLPLFLQWLLSTRKVRS